ncbi:MULTISPECIES: helix-turn-helix transcriptional regulator [unclassified Neisseria]|uniref:XRE family transcriptional regulator n=1 Tax=unclassified Neisseria TaxID=2623750 RepID=UPI00266691D4|nr:MULTISPECIES: helix-turn-helix transcriptional regulator [unclassified Neisseria]MDO1509979.1 helix-turn-helix transcriptional regulator [Neisseria sp. MVDL19-042950]MDO1516179.1 helix-turn-helix transcriptional regulator [Neisseria sp. MVDL18-041461]MDO1563294.1 helix-turn-helix transcriptional regulator [Neisseria sp. MVDL20-010259]
MDTFKDRVLSLWPDLSVTKIADKIGMTYMGLSKIFKNGHIPKAETLLSIHEHSGCDLKWLMTGEGEPFPNQNKAGTAASTSSLKTKESDNPIVLDTLGNPVNLEEFVFIPRYDINASAGNGFPIDTENPLFCMAFRRYWIENYVTTQIEKLSVITVKGDSMEGVLNHGDNILVNHADTNPRDGLYVLRVNNDLIVKRVQALPGRLLVKSANPEYEPFEINLNHDQQDVAIIGRVEWFGRTIN